MVHKSYTCNSDVVPDLDSTFFLHSIQFESFIFFSSTIIGKEICSTGLLYLFVARPSSRPRSFYHVELELSAHERAADPPPTAEDSGVADNSGYFFLVTVIIISTVIPEFLLYAQYLTPRTVKHSSFTVLLISDSS